MGQISIVLRVLVGPTAATFQLVWKHETDGKLECTVSGTKTLVTKLTLWKGALSPAQDTNVVHTLEQHVGSDARLFPSRVRLAALIHNMLVL